MPSRRPDDFAASKASRSANLAHLDESLLREQDDDDARSFASSSSSSSSEPPPVLDEQFLPRILSLFFTIFHPTEGPKVVYQVPEGSVTSEEVGDKRAKGRRASSSKGKQRQKEGEEGHEPSWSPLLYHEPLFDFDTLSDYLIPKASLCGRLITCTARSGSNDLKGSRSQGRSRSRHREQSGRSASRAGKSPHRPSKGSTAAPPRHYKVVSHPVLLQDSAKYERNTFIFNLAFVFDGKADVKSYEPVIRKCARSLKGLEESSSFLSSPKSQMRMYDVVEKLFQDLNTYCEAFVPLPEGHSINYESRPGRHGSDSQLPGFRDPRSWSQSMSLSRKNSVKQQLETARGLSNTAESSLEPARNVQLEDKELVDPKNAEEALEAARIDLNLQMSPLPPIPTPSEGGPAPSPLPPSTLSTAPLASPPPDTNISDLVSSRRSSATGSINGGSILGEARRPMPSRSKTMSTIAINEASASATSSRRPSEKTEADESSSRKTSAASTSSRANGQVAPVTRHWSAPDGLSQSSEHGMVADLSSSLASLRVIQESGSTAQASEDHLPLVARPVLPRLGQREAPHGLGRTVRDAINLKLFPTYPNPPPVSDWDVPVSLLDLGRRAGGDSSNWDLTMARVYPFINGISHVKRIAQLADADLELTRQCMEHLLYYGCVLMVDIFQFFNIYTLRPAIAAMADDPAIQAECGPYVTRPGHVIPAWPTLLSLYTALRPGVILDAWIEDRDVESLGIDVRRFVTFGIIKGFVKRVHRYPFLIGGPDSLGGAVRSPGEFPEVSGILLREPPGQRSGPGAAERMDAKGKGSVGKRFGTLANYDKMVAATKDVQQLSVESNGLNASMSTPERPPASTRQASEAASLRTITGPSTTTPASQSTLKQQQHPSVAANKRSKRPHTPVRHPTTTVADAANAAFEDSGRKEEVKGHASSTRPSKSILLSSGSGGDDQANRSGFWGSGITLTPSAYQYPDTPTTARGQRRESQYFSSSAHGGANSGLFIPPELPDYLDGTHCEDELCVKFGLSWPQLRRILIHIGRATAWSSLNDAGPGAGVSGLQAAAVGGGGRGSHQEEWLMETPAFGNASGFASQSGFAGQSGFGASAWQTSHLAGGTAGIGAAGPRPRRPSLTGAPSGSDGGMRRMSSGGGTHGSSRKVGSQSTLGGPRRSSADFGGASTGPGTIMPPSWTHQLEHLEIEAEEEELEKKGDFGGIVLLTV